MGLRKNLALILTIAMFSSSVPTLTFAEELNTQNTNEENAPLSKDSSDNVYTSDRYKVQFDVNSDWGNGYTGKIMVTNTSTETIRDWALEFKSNIEITSLWNADIYKHDGNNYIIKNCGWNKKIKPGETVEFGFVGTKGQNDKVDIPQQYTIVGYEKAADEKNYKVEFKVNNKWSGAYNGNIIITNTSDKPINSWKLSFDLKDKITGFWNGSMEQNADGSYLIYGDNGSETINPGESVSLGYQASFDGTDVSAEENVLLTEYTYDNDGDQDYDGDGIINKVEDEIGTDKNKKDTNDDGTPDGDTGYDVDKDGKDDNGNDVKFEGNVQGSGVGSVDIDKVPDSEVLVSPTIPGYQGGFEITGDDGSVNEGGKIRIDVNNPSKDNPDNNSTIYKYDPDNQEMVEKPTEKKGNTLITDFDGFGIYVVLNKTEFDKIWQKDIKPFDPTIMNTTSLDVALVIDSSGSMTVNDSTDIRKTVAKGFVDKLSVDDRGAVIDFDDKAKILSDFTNNKSALKTAIDKIDSYGNTSLTAGISSALNILTNTSPKVKKCIVMLTDGVGDYSTALTTQARNNGVIIYTIGLGKGINVNELTAIAKGTKGSYYLADQAGDLYSVFDEVQEESELYKDTDNDGLSDYYEKKLASGEMRLGTGALLSGISYTNPDSDGDGKLDGEELKVVTRNGRVYAQLISNPVVKD